jgi:hypothetical protein
MPVNLALSCSLWCAQLWPQGPKARAPTLISRRRYYLYCDGSGKGYRPYRQPSQELLSCEIRSTPILCTEHFYSTICTVRKMDLILRPIERRPQMQFSLARRFKLQLLRRYSVKCSKMSNFTLERLRLDKLKSTGGRRTNIPWIYSPWLYHCTTGTHVIKAGQS